MNAKLEKMALALDSAEDYRVLRRLTHVPVVANTTDDIRSGIVLDVETTGLEDRDEVIELAMLPFSFTLDGSITSVHEPYHSYREPSVEITEEITELTGITYDMVKGHSILANEVEHVLATTDFVIAHNAQFDRRFAEHITEAFEKKCWGCSMDQVPWKKGGISNSRSLEYVLAGLGRFFKGHNGVADCTATLYALSQPVLGKPALAHVLEASRKKTWHVWACNAPFPPQGQPNPFKVRKYNWNPGEDGRFKAWHREVEDREAEEAWLQRVVYQKLITPAKFVEVNAFTRFSSRG